MSNAICSSRESNPSRRICHLRAVPPGIDRGSRDFQLGELKFRKSYPTAGTDPENFGGVDADLTSIN